LASLLTFSSYLINGSSIRKAVYISFNKKCCKYIEEGADYFEESSSPKMEHIDVQKP
jgi:hypothetical protein